MRMRGNTARGQLGEPRTAAAGVGILTLILVPWDWNFVAGVYAARTARGESQLREMSGPRPRSKFLLPQAGDLGARDHSLVRLPSAGPDRAW